MADDDKLEALEAEYTRIRDDSRNSWAIVGALMSVAVAIASGIAVLAQQTCTDPGVSATCREAPAVLWLLAPLAPITVAILVIQQIALSTIRSSYERALEERVASLQRVQLAPPKNLRVPKDVTLPSPSYSRFANDLFDLRAAPLAFRILLILLNVIGAVLLIGAVAVSINELPGFPLKAIAGFVYVCAGVGLGYAAVLSFDGDRMWLHAVKVTARR